MNDLGFKIYSWHQINLFEKKLLVRLFKNDKLAFKVMKFMHNEYNIHKKYDIQFGW